MTLDQYLGTVAWLFMAFLMWFSFVRHNRCGFKYDYNFAFFAYIVWPSMGWSIVVCAWISSYSWLYITYIGG